MNSKAGQAIRVQVAQFNYNIERQTLENMELQERIASNQTNIDASHRALAEAVAQLTALGESTSG